MLICLCFFKYWYRQIGTVPVSLTFYVMYIEQAVLVVTLAVLVANNGDYVLNLIVVSYLL